MTVHMVIFWVTNHGGGFGGDHGGDHGGVNVNTDEYFSSSVCELTFCQSC